MSNTLPFAGAGNARKDVVGLRWQEDTALIFAARQIVPRRHAQAIRLLRSHGRLGLYVTGSSRRDRT